jgi:hypothetical protein
VEAPPHSTILGRSGYPVLVAAFSAAIREEF